MKPNGPVFDRQWRKSCDVIRVDRRHVKAMIRRHYLKKWPGACVLVLGAKRGWDFIGCIVFALPPRETSKRYGGETWELARLWIADSVPKNAETWLIGQAIRYIRKHHPEVKALVSYADPSAGHSGTIYRAANWTCDGSTDDDRKSPRVDYVDVETGKRYSRRSHVPDGITIAHIPRISKHRFVYHIEKEPR